MKTTAHTPNARRFKRIRRALDLGPLALVERIQTASTFFTIQLRQWVYPDDERNDDEKGKHRDE